MLFEPFSPKCIEREHRQANAHNSSMTDWGKRELKKRNRETEEWKCLLLLRHTHNFQLMTCAGKNVNDVCTVK
jgi:hypothetical protein